MAGLFVHSLIIIEPFFCVWNLFLCGNGNDFTHADVGVKYLRLRRSVEFARVQTYQKKCVTLILYGFRDCPAEIVDPNQLQDFTLGRVSKKSAINILAIHQSSASRNTSEWQRHKYVFQTA